MRLSSLHSKSIFITSLVCFSLVQQSAKAGGTTTMYQDCSPNVTTDGGLCLTSTANGCVSCTIHANQFGAGCANESTSCNATGVNCINIISSFTDPTFQVDAGLPYPGGGTGVPYYLAWDYGGSGTLTFTTGDNYEMGAQVITGDYSNTFAFSNSSTTPTYTVSLTNPTNYFGSGSTLIPMQYTIVEIALGGTNPSDPGKTISGIGSIEFQNGGLSVPYGGTLSLDITNSSGKSGYLYGGTNSAYPLILTGTWSDLSSTSAANLYNYINLSSAATISGDGYVYVWEGCVLGINSNDNFGSGTTLYIDEGTVQFQIGSLSIVNTIMVNTANGGVIDVNGVNCGIDAAIRASSSSGETDLKFINSSVTGGTISLSDGTTGQIDSNIFFGVNPNVTLFSTFTSGATPNIVLTGGILSLEGLTYSSTVYVEAYNSTMAFNGVATATIETLTNNGNPASLYVVNNVSGAQVLNINQGSDYTQVMTVGLDSSLGNSSYPVTVNVWQDLFNGSITVGPQGTVNYYYGDNSSQAATGYAYVYPVTSGGTYVAGTNGATLNIANTESFSISSALKGNITGNLQINFKSPASYTMSFETAGFSITGCVTLNSNCSLAMNAGDELTLVESQAGTGSLIYGPISGSGLITVACATTLGSSTSSFPTNYFNSLTFNTVINGEGEATTTSAILTVYSPLSLGNGFGTLIGNGGELSNKVGGDLTLLNPWILNGLGTTIPAITFEGGGSPVVITGSITTVAVTAGSTAAAMLSPFGGPTVVSFTPSSLTITDGTPLITNGNSMTVGTLSATGVNSEIILGNGKGVPVDDTLTILGGTYQGIISDNSVGNGIVVIEGVVSLLGVNTFSGGLHLSGVTTTTGVAPNTVTTFTAGTLSITDYQGKNLGNSNGTIYFEGGILKVPSVSSGSIITVPNKLSFVGGTTSTFSIASDLVLALTGTSSVTGTSNSAYISVTGGGAVEFGSTYEGTSGDTLTITVSPGGTVSYLGGQTVVAASPSLKEGILRGREESYFALADASSANWKMTNVTSDPAPIVNFIVSGLLVGDGEVTTVEVQAGGFFVPGDEAGPGVFTVTDSVTFDDNSIYIIRTNGTSYSLLDVGDGGVTIGSNVKVLLAPVPGNYTRSQHLVLDAETLSGRFQDLVVPASYFLGTALDYSSSNQVIMDILPRSVFSLATGANAISVSNAIDTAVSWNRANVSYNIPLIDTAHPEHPLLGRVLATLEPFHTVEEMTAAVNQLQPAFFKGFTVVQESNISKVQDTLDLRLKYVLDTKSCYTFNNKEKCCKKDEKPIHTWISGMGNVLAQESNTFAGSPQVGYQSKMGGFATGVDGHFKAFYLGALGGYTTSYIKWRGHQGTGNINTGYAGIYLSAIGDMFYGNLSLIGGFSDFSGRRHIKYPGVDLTAKGNHAGKQLLSHADTGINWNIGGFTIRPFDSFDYITGTETSYIEQGVGPWSLTLNKANAILLKNELGLELSTCLCFLNMKWVISPKASWIREVRVKGDSYEVFFTTVNLIKELFTVTGYFPDRSLFSPGVSLTGSMCQDRLSVELSYKGEFTHGYSDHSYAGEVRYGF